MTEADTSWIVDASHYEAGMSVAALMAQGYSGFIAKCTEGSTWWDHAYPSFYSQSMACGMPFMAYHFLHRGAADSQAANLAARIIDKTIPVMIDCEKSGGANLADVLAFTKGCASRGIKVVLNYLPRSWWESLGRPSLASLSGVLMEAAYPSSRQGFGSVLYPGPNNLHWAAYGGIAPTLWQFTSTGRISGYDHDLDISAFRGTPGQLAALGLFKIWPTTPIELRPVAPPTVPEDDMPYTVKELQQILLTAPVENRNPDGSKGMGTVGGILTNNELDIDRLKVSVADLDTKLDQVLAAIAALPKDPAE